MMELELEKPLPLCPLSQCMASACIHTEHDSLICLALLNTSIFSQAISRVKGAILWHSGCWLTALTD